MSLFTLTHYIFQPQIIYISLIYMAIWFYLLDLLYKKEDISSFTNGFFLYPHISIIIIINL